MTEQRTTMEEIAYQCVRFQGYEPQSLMLMGINISIPPTVPRNQYIKQLIGQVTVALAPIISIMRLANVVKAIFDMLKATLTLDIPTMTEAFKAIVEIIGDVLGMIPQTSVPKFIWDLLKLFVQLIDVLTEEIQAIVDFEDSLVVNDYNAEVVACQQEALAEIKLQKTREVSAFLLILEPINIMLGLIGQDEIAVPEVDSFDKLLEVLSVLRDTLSALLGD